MTNYDQKSEKLLPLVPAACSNLAFTSGAIGSYRELSGAIGT